MKRHFIEDGTILLEDSVIRAVDRGSAEITDPEITVIDAGGLYVAPGFIELHTHGAGGADFMDGSPESILQAARAHMEHGATSLVPTTLTSTMEDLFSTIDNFKIAKEQIKNGPELLGLHLEGPYFSMAQKGAQDPRYIKDPDPEEYRKIIAYADGAIVRWSVAPELPGAIEMGDYLVEHGILPSIAHTDAEYCHVLEAFRHGYTHVTHLYSGMSTITRKSGFRHLGVIESSYAIEDLTVEIIADGCHLPIELLQMIYRAKGADKICLISDSMRCAGQDTAKSILGSLQNGQEVIIEDGVAKLPDRSAFASSIATDDRLVRVMYREAGINLCDCIAMMSATPAKVMGISHRKGGIEPGKDADLVIFDDQINLSKVICKGTVTKS